MTERTDLWIGTRRLFWGFFFLLLDFHLNLGSAFTIPLVPNFVGWIFLWRGADILSSARPSLGLLKPFCGVLGVFSLTQFLPALEAAAPGWLTLLLSVISLYTDFQLLTDLAALAQEALGEGAEGQTAAHRPDPDCGGQDGAVLLRSGGIPHRPGGGAYGGLLLRAGLSAVSAVGTVQGPGDTAEPVGRSCPQSPPPGDEGRSPSKAFPLGRMRG